MALLNAFTNTDIPAGAWLSDGATITLGGPIGLDTTTGAQTVTAGGNTYTNVTSVTVNDGTAANEQSVVVLRGEGLVRLLGNIEGMTNADVLIGRSLEGFVLMWDGETIRFSRGADADEGIIALSFAGDLLANSVTLENTLGGPTNHRFESTAIGMTMRVSTDNGIATFRAAQKINETFRPYKSVAEMGNTAIIEGDGPDDPNLFAKISTYSVHTKGNDPQDLIHKIGSRVKRVGTNDIGTQPGDLLPLEIAMASGQMYVMPRRNGMGGGQVLICPEGATDILQGPRWAASEAVAVDDIRRVSYNMCLALKCVIAGTTGTAEPNDPPAYYSQITDGGVTWEVVPTILRSTGTPVKPSLFIDQDGRVGFNTWAPVASNDFAGLARFRQGVQLHGDGVGTLATVDKVLTRAYSAAVNTVVANATKVLGPINTDGATLGDDVRVIAPVAAMINGITYDAYVSASGQLTMRVHNHTTSSISVGVHTVELIVTHYS